MFVYFMGVDLSTKIVAPNNAFILIVEKEYSDDLDQKACVILINDTREIS